MKETSGGFVKDMISSAPSEDSIYKTPSQVKLMEPSILLKMKSLDENHN